MNAMKKPSIDLPPADTPFVLHVSLGQQFGKTRYYPENELARQLAQLVKRDVLTPEHVETIKRLGFRIFLVPRSVQPTEL